MTHIVNSHELRFMRSEHGYALPSTLLLITILSFVAAAVISLVFAQHQQALREVAQVRAEYAAQSGVARILSRCTTNEDLTSLMSPTGQGQHFAFDRFP